MVNVVGTSFIPKKSFSSGVGMEEKKKGKSIDLALLIAVIIFVFIVVSSIGTFLYKGFLERKIDESSVMLEREKSNFDIDSISKIIRLGKRINISNQLLDSHTDLANFFAFLEKNTLKNIQFKDFDFSTGDDGIIVSMSGLARNYSAVVLQSDVFGESVFIKDPIFSNLDVNTDGDVVFDFTAVIDIDLISYSKNLE